MKALNLENQKMHLSQKLSGICGRIMETAGIIDPNGEPAAALEALRQLKRRLESTRKELEDYKLKITIAEEKQRLNELRVVCRKFWRFLLRS
ncbi:hypothetical protein M758_9G121900 [Ceratodon purpureus]|uniref:Uncharacterized protein n=1 Tax=Ceratodon purpureus TaxID=3225 RepID=A0A8T0GQR8_CERPU|nr:hypothetical protein KC19_9G106700 [Ceratodon purpureus]KAG0606202.1 hypothetical protein M758_9G121900 [Ceratodon purpureus]